MTYNTYLYIYTYIHIYGNLQQTSLPGFVHWMVEQWHAASELQDGGKYVVIEGTKPFKRVAYCSTETSPLHRKSMRYVLVLGNTGSMYRITLLATISTQHL